MLVGPVLLTAPWLLLDYLAAPFSLILHLILQFVLVCVPCDSAVNLRLILTLILIPCLSSMTHRHNQMGPEAQA